MQKDLISNLSSSYFEALSALSSKKDPKKILVYVESDDDISFWRYILNEYESNNIIFEINLPFKNHYEKGKQNLLKNFKENLGHFLIICLDSDYDYLLKNSNEISSLLNNSPYIFQTYTYSIENLLCHANSLKSLCVNCTKVDIIEFDIESIITTYSEIIYDLLIWSIYFYKINDPDKFTISSFCDITKLLSNNDLENHFKEDFNVLKEKVSSELIKIEELHKCQIENKRLFEQELNNLGIKKVNCYLYAQGHLVLNNFILMILKPICNHLKSKKIKTIKDNCLHNTHISNEIKSYKSNLIEIEKAILINYNFNNSEPYNKIMDDLGKYVSELNSSFT